jgi:hypothetical protein
MNLRAETVEALTRPVVNSVALKTIESERVQITTGAASEPFDCLTTAAFVLAILVSQYATPKQPTVLLVNEDWARFQQLVKEWHAECGTTSSPIEMAMCPAYQKIIALGKPAIRLILKQLELEGDDPDHWFWALHYLTGEDPVAPKDRGNLKKMSAAWLRWGRNNLYYAL